MTAYRLAKLSGGRISTSTVYRLVETRGRAKMYDGDVLEGLADVLGVTIGDLFERVTEAPKRPRRSAVPPSKRSRRAS